MFASTLTHSLIALAIAATYCQAQTMDLNGGYLSSGDGQPVRSAYGDCWRTAAWTEDSASQDCDPQLVVKEAPKAPLVPAPTPPKRLSFATEVLFDFEQAELDADSRKVLDDLASKLLATDIEKVTGTAHSDRIGAASYNDRLSARRAEAIRVYLVGKGLPEKLMHFDNKGAREPITVGRCDGMGPETKQNVKLVACLQPDRRVDIEVWLSRQASNLQPSH